ncbi:nitroreductase [Heliobacterium undosum]|uniref:Nitroreductase n=1 Tax=Heliomicrobium undosum TaxID=121734 RepID=A0A845L524_9FIRM|nr:nitroreductase family protein [Heliomicrobium undosum]MZP30806.1 nitroreductase [Heliomicrobium undosum]
MLYGLVARNRSFRRFHESHAVSRDTLTELIELARLSASGANRQPLKYILSCDREKNERIFPTLAWAGYLKEWPGPIAGERPSAYIIILGDREISQNYFVDHGIASQSILLGAVEKGLGGCIIASIKRQELAEALQIPERYEILLVIALGKPKETVVIEQIGADGDVKYWRDEDGTHHVPKRPLRELILE